MLPRFGDNGLWKDQTDPKRGAPKRLVVGHHLDGQPGGVGGEGARREMVESDAVLQVSDGVLYLGVAAMVGLQLQGFPVPVGDEAVIAVAGEEGVRPLRGGLRRSLQLVN